jgi:hypothetical protein
MHEVTFLACNLFGVWCVICFFFINRLPSHDMSTYTQETREIMVVGH